MEQYLVEMDPATNSAMIFSPYNRDFIKRVKLLGGKWDAEHKAWVVPDRAVEEARAAMVAVYGRDDREPSQTVDVILRFPERYESDIRSSISLMGRTLARAHGRDSGASIGDGVMFLEGSPDSDGSVKNWYTVIKAGSVVKLLDVPKNLALSTQAPKKIEMEIVEKTQSESVAALKKERESLLARIEEIDKLLSKEGENV